MKKLPLLVLFCGCVTVPRNYGYEAHDEPGGTRVTIVSSGVSLLFPNDGRPRGAMPDSRTTWFAGVVSDGNVYGRNAEVMIELAPEATTLAEQETSLRMGCLKLEVMERAESAGGFEIFYACTNKNLDSFFQFIRVADVNGRKVQCRFGGTLTQAKRAEQVCATMEAAAPAPATPAQQAAR